MDGGILINYIFQIRKVCIRVGLCIITTRKKNRIWSFLIGFCLHSGVHRLQIRLIVHYHGRILSSANLCTKNFYLSLEAWKINRFKGEIKIIFLNSCMYCHYYYWHASAFISSIVNKHPFHCNAMQLMADQNERIWTDSSLVCVYIIV